MWQALPTAEGDSSAPAAIVAAARTATAAVRSNAAVTSVNDVQCEGSLSTVWLGDGDGCVSVVDYRRGRTSKVRCALDSSTLVGCIDISCGALLEVVVNYLPLKKYDQLSACVQRWMEAAYLLCGKYALIGNACVRLLAMP